VDLEANRTPSTPTCSHAISSSPQPLCSKQFAVRARRVETIRREGRRGPPSQTKGSLNSAYFVRGSRLAGPLPCASSCRPCRSTSRCRCQPVYPMSRRHHHLHPRRLHHRRRLPARALVLLRRRRIRMQAGGCANRSASRRGQPKMLPRIRPWPLTVAADRAATSAALLAEVSLPSSKSSTFPALMELRTLRCNCSSSAGRSCR
jgi:hypothetical protein